MSEHSYVASVKWLRSTHYVLDIQYLSILPFDCEVTVRSTVVNGDGLESEVRFDVTVTVTDHVQTESFNLHVTQTAF